MKFYPTPNGYQTFLTEPLFPGACEECLGDGCILHPVAGRISCLICNRHGSELRADLHAAVNNASYSYIRLRRDNQEVYMLGEAHLKTKKRQTTWEKYSKAL